MNPNKEVILITAHTPDNKRKDLLKNLVQSIDHDTYDIVVSCNSKVHEDLYDYCDYVLYDKENRLIYDFDKKMGIWWGNGSFVINTTEIKKFNHIIAAASLIVNGLAWCKTAGYEKVHFLEYDSKILDNAVFVENAKLLNDHSVVFYNHWRGHGVFSSYSINLNKIPDFWLDTRLPRLYEYIENPNNKILEEYTMNLVGQTPDFCVRDWHEYDKCVKTNLFNSNTTEEWVVAVKEDDNFIGFSTNREEGSDELRVLFIINDQYVITTQVEYGCWTIKNLGKVEDIHNVKILVNGSLKNEYDFTKIDKDKYMSKNFITKHKENDFDQYVS